MSLVGDPIDWLLGTDGDIVITDDVAWATGIPARAQQARIALQSVKGEWFINPDEGVPYWERDNVTADEALLGQRFDRLKCLGAFRDALVSIPDITIKTLTVDFSSALRAVTVKWSITCEFGDTDLSTLIVPMGAN